MVRRIHGSSRRSPPQRPGHAAKEKIVDTPFPHTSAIADPSDSGLSIAADMDQRSGALEHSPARVGLQVGHGLELSLADQPSQTETLGDRHKHSVKSLLESATPKTRSAWVLKSKKCQDISQFLSFLPSFFTPPRGTMSSTWATCAMYSVMSSPLMEEHQGAPTTQYHTITLSYSTTDEA